MANEICFLLKYKRLFRVMQSSSFDPRLLGKNAMKGTARNKKLRIKEVKSSAENVEIIGHAKLEVSSPPKKMAKAELSMTASKATGRNAEKLSNGK